jgi:hypothetical protein
MTYGRMPIDALNLPLQLFALGSALGMTGALIYHAHTGEVGHWSVFVAVPSVALFTIGIMQTIVGALT